MLLKSNLTASNVEEIVYRVSEDYQRNLTCDVMDVGRARDGRFKVRFTLAVRDSYGRGARTSASGRHMPKASWQAHRDVMQGIFASDPDAFLHTALADYRGARDFAYKFEATGDKNVGSIIQPVCFRDTTV